jgi:hypothetical protein
MNTLGEQQVNMVMAEIRWETRGMPTNGTERRNENNETNDGKRVRVRTGLLSDFFPKTMMMILAPRVTLYG